MSPSTARRLTKWPDSYSTPFWGLLVGSSQGGQGKDSYRVDPGGNTELTLVSRPIRFSSAKICRSSEYSRPSYTIFARENMSKLREWSLPLGPNNRFPCCRH